MPNTFLDQKVTEIHERLTELRPLVDEYQRLEAAERALAGVTGNGTPQPVARKRASRGRPRGSGNRSAQALEAIQSATDGISAATLAKQMGINPTYLYRVLPALAADGKILKDGQLWKAVRDL